MNKPAIYQGGVSTRFKRAEQAANFGREIGLLYVHAHIRYVEAMAKAGYINETWDNLLKINPINIQDHVPNAQRRQSNTYFSSSDAAFDDRYKAQENYDQLRKGQIQVKGGWRIYSSGPGIYLNQLITNVLGLRFTSGEIIFDPVLPKRLNGIQIHLELMSCPVIIELNSLSTEKGVFVNNKKIQAETNFNAYRKSGWIVDKNELSRYLTKKQNKITINY